MPRRSSILLVAALAVALSLSAAAGGAGSSATPQTGALQIALRAHGFYKGPLDGIPGPNTLAALVAFQQRSGVPVSGRLDARTRKLLRRLGKPLAGRRVVGTRMVGWDVSVLEFGLARRGFDVGAIDGRYTSETRTAVQRFQRYAGLPVDGAAGKATFRALEQAPPARVRHKLTWPMRTPIARRYGLEGNHLRPGVDLSAPYGTPFAAAGDGRVTWAGWSRSGLGLLVAVQHDGGVQTLYGHLSRVDVKVGQRVVRGGLLGLVGWTGKASQPHLYLEVRVRGAAVNPMTALK
ncbi:MAG: peptidoglycan-binding protein [Actinobacteria bacterium]|nr:peptidoglycan-binding protein [Actinomycetota bacterium]